MKREEEKVRQEIKVEAYDQVDQEIRDQLQQSQQLTVELAREAETLRQEKLDALKDLRLLKEELEIKRNESQQLENTIEGLNSDKGRMEESKFIISYKIVIQKQKTEIEKNKTQGSLNVADIIYESIM